MRISFDKPATKADLESALRATSGDVQAASRELREFIREREVSSIRWFVATFIGAQIAYFAITLGAVYFLLGHLAK